MNLAALITLANAIGSLLPAVLSMLDTLEKQFPNTTFEQRLEQVETVLKSVEGLTEDLDTPFKAVKTLLSVFKTAA